MATFVAAKTANFGSLNSAQVGSTTFDATGADLLVVAVSWTYIPTIPIVTYGGVQMTHCLEPLPNDDLRGTCTLFYLKNPPAGTQTLSVYPPAFFLGNTQVGLLALNNTNGFLGARAGFIFSDTIPQALTLPATVSGSLLTAFCFVEYGQPATMAPSAGWTQQADTIGPIGSAFTYTSATLGGDKTLTVTPPGFAQGFLIGIEVFDVAHGVPSLPESVTAASATNIGIIGNESASVTFNAAGADMLLVAIGQQNTAPPPTLTYAGIPLVYLDQPVITSEVGAIHVAVLIDPPPGSQELVVTGAVGYFGESLVMMIGVNGISGVSAVNNSGYNGGWQINVPLTDPQPNAMLVAFASSNYSRAPTVPNERWTQRATVAGTTAYAWIFTGPGDYPELELLQNAFSSTQVICLELQADIQVTPDFTGTGNVTLPAFSALGAGNYVLAPEPDGQEYRIYYEMFFDPINWPDIWPNPQPADFVLANMPSYVSTIILAFGFPLFTYVNMDSNVMDTTGLYWRYPAQLLKDVISLLKSRCPGTKVLLSVQQSTPAEYIPEPYNPLGWGGMTSDNVASMLQFITDVGIDGIDIDYECLSQDNNFDHHCVVQPDKTVICYTDAEQISVIKAIRAGIPRPLIVTLYGLHVGCYGAAPYTYTDPFGYNGGYNICVSKDADALAALDGIHLGSYDAYPYDPRVALEAFQLYFPDTPIFIGLRVGPPEYGTGPANGYKRTLYELTDFVNHTIVRGAAGAFCYATFWPIYQPTGDINVNYPDSAMTSRMAGVRYGKSNLNLPLIGDQLQNGTVVTVV